MNCPDCNIKMELIDKDTLENKLEIPYYKCPNCRIEIEVEDE